MRLICAIVKLLTYRAGQRRERFSEWFGGEE